MHRIFAFNQSQWLNHILRSTQKKDQKKKKNNGKAGKVLYKLMDTAIYRKTMENLRNRIYVKLVNNKKDKLNCTSKPSYISHKIFDSNLVPIRKSRLALNRNKPA